MQGIGQSAYPDARWADVRISYPVITEGAAEDASVSASAGIAASNVDQTHDGNVNMDKLATMEPNQHYLDGSFRFTGGAQLQIGWISNFMSDYRGWLTTPQTLYYTFPEDVSSAGITIVFDRDDYCTSFNIITLDADDTQIDLHQKTGNDKSTYVYRKQLNNYRTIVIQLSGTSKPYRRAKIGEVLFGVLEEFNRDNLIDVRILRESSPTSESLASSELSFTFENLDKRFDTSTSDSLYAYLKAGQEIDVEIGVGNAKTNIEYVRAGKFYFANLATQNNGVTAQIVAYDKFMDLEREPYSLYSSVDTTLAQAVALVITQSGLPIDTFIDSAIGSRVVKQTFPTQSPITCREALRLLAQASMTRCYFDEHGELRFVDFNKKPSAVDALSLSNQYIPPQAQASEKFNRVLVVVRDDFAETETLYGDYFSMSDVFITKNIENPLIPVSTGAAVTRWLRDRYNKTMMYVLQERGHPGREIGDTILFDFSKTKTGIGVVARQEIIYNGALSMNTTVWEGV